jgi:hypothetical protein
VAHQLNLQGQELQQAVEVLKQVVQLQFQEAKAQQELARVQLQVVLSQ